MKNQYEYTINSADDIRRALDEADRENIYLTHYNSAFHLRGAEGESISVDDSLADLHVVAHGPAVVWASGEGRTTVIAEGRPSSTPWKAVSLTRTTPPPCTPTTTPRWWFRWTPRYTSPPTTCPWRPGETPRSTSPPGGLLELTPAFAWRALPKSFAASQTPVLRTDRIIP
nr:MAG TPA: hypothetical protein [Caudoviricetes sp.]